jgi:Zn-finger nucleic acid-binding protein
MTPETRSGVTADRCDRCGGLWFDAEELDRWLGDAYVTDAGPPESRIPPRGDGSRPCPRCDCAMHTAGWTGLVLDRCGKCRGLFVEASEIIRLQKDGLPDEAGPFESRLADAMVDAGWTLLVATDLALLIMRFLRRA